MKKEQKVWWLDDYFGWLERLLVKAWQYAKAISKTTLAFVAIYGFIGVYACVVNVVFKSPAARLYWNLSLLILVFGVTINILIHLRRERKT